MALPQFQMPFAVAAMAKSSLLATLHAQHLLWLHCQTAKRAFTQRSFLSDLSLPYATRRTEKNWCSNEKAASVSCWSWFGGRSVGPSVPIRGVQLIFIPTIHGVVAFLLQLFCSDFIAVFLSQQTFFYQPFMEFGVPCIRGYHDRALDNHFY